MRKRFLLISTIIVLSAFTFAACGKKSPSSPESTNSETTTAEPTTEENTEKDTTEEEKPVATAHQKKAQKNRQRQQQQQRKMNRPNQRVQQVLIMDLQTQVL